jgi:microcystin-dependent protein
MTQAVNLANFSNSLDSSGGVPPTQLNAVVPLSKGGTNASTASAARASLDVAQAVFSVPSGGIIMWSGSIASIPTGWLLCNGSSGTPDLRNRFVIGAGSTYGVAATGGSTTRTLTTNELPSHSHTASSTDSGHSHSSARNGTPTSGVNLNGFAANSYDGNNNAPIPTTTGFASITTNIGSTGSGASFDILNPYYALAFIMKS